MSLRAKETLTLIYLSSGKQQFNGIKKNEIKSSFVC